MEPIDAATPEVGAIVFPDTIDTAIVIIEIFDVELARATALLIIAALLFFFGVALSCILRLNGKVHWSKVFLSSIVVFCLASPAWAYTLEGNWSEASSMPVLDGVFRWQKMLRTDAEQSVCGRHRDSDGHDVVAADEPGAEVCTQQNQPTRQNPNSSYTGQTPALVRSFVI
jgi:hypothetical protein